MFFSLDQRLLEIFPDLRIGVIVVEVDNSFYGNDPLDIVLEEVRKNFSYERPQDHPYIKVWREAFSKVGISPSKFYSSVEALLRRVLKGGQFPRINPLVDLYNALSLKYVVPIGGHALEAIKGNIYVSFAEGNETFFPMNGEELERVDKGEVVYKDDEEILTRRWVWRQCEKDKVTEETKYVFLPVDLMEGVPSEIFDCIVKDLELHFKENKNGSILLRDMVLKNKSKVEFDLSIFKNF